jgi:hypothetical protein
MHVDLEIGELILRGVAWNDRVRVADALERELTRLLAQHGVPSPLTRGAGAPEVQAGAIHVGHGTSPQSVGRQLAAAVYGSLGTL